MTTLKLPTTDVPRETPDVEVDAPAGPAPTEPPRKRGRPRKNPTAPTTSTGRKRAGRPSNADMTVRDRTARVTRLYESLGGMIALGSVMDARLAPLGTALVENAPQLGAAWAQWAETSPTVARMIDGMSVGGGGLAVLVAHAPLWAAIRRGMSGDVAEGDELAGLLTKLVTDAAMG